MKRSKIIYSLNGVRGFAVLLVLFSHASNFGFNLHPNVSFSGAGRYGVFLFFVLSAFLLTKQFLDHNFKKGEINTFVAHYFKRRFLRIYPLFTFALVVYYLLHKFGYSIYQIDEVVFIKTLFLMTGKGIFWTIPVEFQYYFILPIISLAFIKIRHPIVIIAFVIIFTSIWWHYIPPKYVKNILPFFPIFLLGSLTAYISHRVKFNSSHKKYLTACFNILSILCLFSFFLLIANFYNYLFNADISKSHFHKSFFLLSLLSCCLIFFTIHGNGIIKKIMESRILVFWGNISFSAYLWHMIFLQIITTFSQLPSEINFIIFLVTTASCSYLSFKLIELPLSKGQLFGSTKIKRKTF